MSFFKILAALIAKGVEVQITVSAADAGKLEVVLIPTSTTGKSGLNLVAKSFVGTPDELEAEFGDVLATYCQVNASLADQLNALQAEADAIAEKAKADAKANAKAPASTVSSVAKSVVPQRQSSAKAGGADVMEGDEAGGGDEGGSSSGCGTPDATASDADADRVISFTM